MKKLIWLIVLIFGVNYIAIGTCKIPAAIFDSLDSGIYFSLTTFIIVAAFILWHKIDKVEKLLRQKDESKAESEAPPVMEETSEENK